jgi:sterol desaturase/sphingolipid hydroxylase (fatty acid hydroxylase superfamily)
MNETLGRLPPVIFVIAFAVLWSWEAMRAHRPAGADPARRRRNLALSALSFMLGGAVAALSLAAAAFAAQHHWGLAGAAWLPAWAVVLAGLLLMDLADYASHRLAHRIPWWWRLHRVHHADPQMDITTTLRSHPLDQLLRPLFIVAAILLGGIAPLAVMLQPLFVLPVLLFEHCNVGLPAAVDRVLALLIPTPAVHLVHHSRRALETDSNYGTCLTLWDRLFGTFRAPAAQATIGLDGFDGPRHQTLAGMLGSPWREAESTFPAARRRESERASA